MSPTVSREYPLIDDGRRATQLRPSSTDQPAGQSKGSNQYIFGEKLKDNLEQYNLEIQPTYLEKKNNWEQPILGNPINIYLGKCKKIFGGTQLQGNLGFPENMHSQSDFPGLFLCEMY